jgi:predicted Zn-ribbon and HTH transcriptional regulator
MNHKVKIDGYLCKRCGHTWLPRNKEYEPEVCPKCKSAYWNREIKREKERI